MPRGICGRNQGSGTRRWKSDSQRLQCNPVKATASGEKVYIGVLYCDSKYYTHSNTSRPTEANPNTVDASVSGNARQAFVPEGTLT